jgi:hypothetical protein
MSDPLISKNVRHNGKVIPVLIKHYSITHMGNENTDPCFLDIGNGWRRVVVRFRIRPLHLLGMNPSTHWIGGWLGHRGGLDNMGM